MGCASFIGINNKMDSICPDIFQRAVENKWRNQGESHYEKQPRRGMAEMCSACSGNYEGDRDGWESPSACEDGAIECDSFECAETLRRESSQRQSRGPRRGDTRNQDLARHYPQGIAEYEVLVSADEIIEIHKFIGDSAGLRDVARKGD